jgi:hypothetical protein
MPCAHTPAFAIGEAILDLLMQASVDDTASALAYVIRHHAIHAELMGGDDCCIAWLAQVRAAVDGAEEKLGDYINRENGTDDGRKAAILAEPQRRAA